MIDPETGAVPPDGEKGELVLTSLTKEYSITHRTRDLIATVAAHGALACGEQEKATWPFRRRDHPARRHRS